MQSVEDDRLGVETNGAIVLGKFRKWRLIWMLTRDTKQIGEDSRPLSWRPSSSADTNKEWEAPRIMLRERE